MIHGGVNFVMGHNVAEY